jgi:hypothetical protein
MADKAISVRSGSESLAFGLGIAYMLRQLCGTAGSVRDRTAEIAQLEVANAELRRQLQSEERNWYRYSAELAPAVVPVTPVSYLPIAVFEAARDAVQTLVPDWSTLENELMEYIEDLSNLAADSVSANPLGTSVIYASGWCDSWESFIALFGWSPFYWDTFRFQRLTWLTRFAPDCPFPMTIEPLGDWDPGE